MRNDDLLWYLIGRRRGRREALRALGHEPVRRPRGGAFLFLFCLVLIGAVFYALAVIATAIQRTH